MGDTQKKRKRQSMAHDVLIVDDEADIRALIEGVLEDEGFRTRATGDSDGALQAIRKRRPDLVVLDIWLQDSTHDGMALLDLIQREHPTLPVVMISGHGNIETAVAAIKRGAYDFIEKPFKADRLLLVARRAIEAAQLKRENEELRLRAGGEAELVGASPSISQIRQSIERVAPTASRVLITGPAGVGKEVVARRIHQASPRRDGPFVVLNCATMRPDRLEIELFGAAPGAEGADSAARLGTFERAHGGTLLLDEVADMPMETQGKIVRALQEQTFERVGGATQVVVDVRVVASSNRDLQKEMAAHRFREDLYYRLNVVPIRVPPLRDRREDIPLLADNFMNRSATRAGLAPRALADDAIAALQAYDWPGNVRQLSNIIDWLLIMAPGDGSGEINAELLPPEITSRTPNVPNFDRSSEIMGLPLREAREIFERQYLVAQMSRFGGNISRTAAFVGMERSALHRKLKTLGVHGTEKAHEFDA